MFVLQLIKYHALSLRQFQSFVAISNMNRCASIASIMIYLPVIVLAILCHTHRMKTN